MFPIKMLHQINNLEKAVEVSVYAIEHTHDVEGGVVASFATAWNSKLEQWIVAPLWEFKPIENKVLKEDM